MPWPHVPPSGASRGSEQKGRKQVKGHGPGVRPTCPPPSTPLPPPSAGTVGYPPLARLSPCPCRQPLDLAAPPRRRGAKGLCPSDPPPPPPLTRGQGEALPSPGGVRAWPPSPPRGATCSPRTVDACAQGELGAEAGPARGSLLLTPPFSVGRVLLRDHWPTGGDPDEGGRHGGWGCRPPLRVPRHARP